MFDLLLISVALITRPSFVLLQGVLAQSAMRNSCGYFALCAALGGTAAPGATSMPAAKHLAKTLRQQLPADDMAIVKTVCKLIVGEGRPAVRQFGQAILKA